MCIRDRYDTVDIALKRLGYYNGILLLGSATPSVVSYSRVEQGIYKLLKLEHRYNKTPLPSVSIVDMREELKQGNTSIFSGQLYSAIKEELEEGRQVILLQNRRGYANFVSCRSCGKFMKCPDCGISLTYHKSKNKLLCHYCGKSFEIPKFCPECESSYIKYFGIGTEQVEEAVNEYFPGVETDRLDIDALKTRKDLDRILGAFAKGDTKVLIGTQLVAKGLDFDNVGLVGVIAADTTLNIPDYRSSERTFQLITQAAGRAGRGDRRGRVIIPVSYTHLIRSTVLRRRIFIILTALILAFGVFDMSAAFGATSVKASLTGGSCNKGQNITVTLTYSGTTFGSATASFKYDTTKLQLVGSSDGPNSASGVFKQSMINEKGSSTLSCTCLLYTSRCV